MLFNQPKVTLAAQVQAPNGGEDSVQVFLNAGGFAIMEWRSG
jgi:hypothetical protein